MTRSRVLVALGGLAISAIFLWLAIRDADAGAVREALDDAEIELVLLASAVFMVGYFVPGVSLAEHRRRAAARASAVLRDGARRPRLQQRPAGPHRRAPPRGMAEPRGADAGRARARKRRPRPGVRRRHARPLPRRSASRPCRRRTWLGTSSSARVLLVVLIAGAWSSRVCTRGHADRDRRERGRVRRIVRDTIDLLGEPVGRRRAAVWLGLSIVAWSSARSPCTRRPLGRDRPRPARGRLRRLGARARRRDPLVARLHRDVPVARRRVARPPRRRRERGARVLDPHARELVRPDDARGRRDHRLARAADALKVSTWDADTLR